MKIGADRGWRIGWGEKMGGREVLVTPFLDVVTIRFNDLEALYPCKSKKPIQKEYISFSSCIYVTELILKTEFIQ